MSYEVEKGHPLPNIKGGRTRQATPIREAVESLKAQGVPTPEGGAAALWFPGVEDKEHLDVRRALSQLQKAGAEFGVTVVRHWEPSKRGRVKGSHILFYVVPRMAGPGRKRNLKSANGSAVAATERRTAQRRTG